MLQGIDVSKYQKHDAIDWKLVKKQVSFVYVKASEGVNYVDPAFVNHVNNARKVGLSIGAYHYLRVRHGRPQDADVQAEQFCDLVKEQELELLPALDVELQGNEQATQDEWVDAITMFLSTVEKRIGRKAFLYTYPSFWASKIKLANNIKFAEHPLWIAHYTTAPSPIIPPQWKDWKMWQYAASAGVIGKVEGIPGSVDRNVLKGLLDDIVIREKKPSNLIKVARSFLHLFKKK